VPATTDFAVSGGKTVTGVDVSGTAVTVTVNSAYISTDVITISYTPGTNKIQDGSGNLASALTNQSVTNNISSEVAFVKGYGLTDGDIVVEGTGWKKTNAAAGYDIISSTTQTLAVGGYFYLQASNNISRTLFGFILSTNNSPTATVDQFLHGLLLWNTNGVYTYENGSFTGSSYGTVSNGDYFRVWYENATTVKFQKSTDGGLNYTTIRTSSLNPASANYKVAIILENQNETVLDTKLKLS